MATLERRELANTGLKLSCLGFGASPLGNVFSDVPPADALASVRLALQHGFNFFDTSPFASSPCSTPERCRLPLILAYIIPFPLGDRRLHQCGCYIDGFDFSAERVTRSIDESLARLKLDYVDILHCHDIEFGSLDQDARRDAAAHCKEKGKNISKVALQYSLMNKEIATILVGMNSPKQVEENVAAALGLSSLGID
ncbi:L-galactose dehydrogenase [Musa troglodytarum]|uniref:L-galactose dehydrogenase n=1 Tax=Musa troglodytarum TaxID=320322 RepID=A0A9E7GXE1_9LILI|nr:L-galactose dehydrogenase [Musa troglodytarum]